MDIPWRSLRTGLTPPPPNSSSSKQEVSSQRLENVGHHLIALVRALEKPNNANRDNQVKQVADILRDLAAIYSRCGLLQGDVAKAERITASSTVFGGVHRDKRRKKKIRTSAKDRRIDGEVANESTVVDDQALVLSSIVRILGGTADSSTSSEKLSLDDVTLSAGAADVITSISERIKSLIALDTCALAEYELMSSSARSILTGMSRTMNGILSEMLCNRVDVQGNRIYCGWNSSEERRDTSDGSMTTTESAAQGQKVALVTCLRASASLLALFGTRLSRSSSILTELGNAGWSALSIPQDDIQLSAAILLATIPLTGGSNKSTPVDVWNSYVVETATALFVLLDAMAPLKRLSSSESAKQSRDLLKRTNTIIDGWLNHIRRDLEREGQRGRAFHHLIRGLVKLLLALLGRKGYDSRAQSVLTCASIPVDYMLDLTEMMVSFPTAAETMYYGTKRQLRLEPIPGGLLSPKDVAFDIANHVKSSGHDVLDALVSGLDGPAALPYGRRIMRITYASLLTSCSGPLRKVMDPTGTARLDGKKRRWLHTSIPIRTRAIESFKVVTFACGSNIVVSPSKSGGGEEGKITSNDGNKCIMLVGGCLLEQVTWKGPAEEESDDDWGSLVERVELATMAADTLSACLVVCRGYMQLKSRSLVDSIVSTCISSISGKINSHICSSASLRCALLKLGTNCLCTPWPDGAMSPLMDSLRQASLAYKCDRDSNVSAAANTALCICDALSMPRAPPLTIVTRTDSKDEATGEMDDGTSASSVIEGINAAREQYAQAMKAKQASGPIGSKDTQVQSESTRGNKKARLEKEPGGKESENKPSVTHQTGDSFESQQKDKSTAAASVVQESSGETLRRKDENTEDRKEERDMSMNLSNDGPVAPDDNAATVVEKCEKEENPSTDLSDAVHQQLSLESGPADEVDSNDMVDPEELLQQVMNKEKNDTDDEDDLPAIFDGGPDDDDM